MISRWQPTASIETLKQRSEILWNIREFFHERGVHEVQTPVVGSHTVTDPHIESIQLVDGRYLQTSPEYFLKRLLAAGMSSCFQLGPVFRKGEQGRWHNSEFTMLEWYRVGFTSTELRHEVIELVNLVLGEKEVQEFSFREFLLKELQLDCLTASDDDLLVSARRHGFPQEPRRADELDFLYATAIEQNRDTRYFVIDFPPESCALAEKHNRGGYEVADRFELIIDGLEIANGYNELREPSELSDRMDNDRAIRHMLDRSDVKKDQRLLDAMKSGLPKCAGVAVGLDRLIALAVGATCIQNVLCFPN